jgi:kumamolisin
MASSDDRVELPGSQPPEGVAAHVVGPVDPDEPITVTVTVRPRVAAPTDAEIEKMFMQPVKDRDDPSREAQASAQSADPDALAKVEEFARGHGLKILETDPATRRVVLCGKAAELAKAFGATLNRFQHAGSVFRGLSSPIYVPAKLAPAIESVLGLDDRPVAGPR